MSCRLLIYNELRKAVHKLPPGSQLWAIYLPLFQNITLFSFVQSQYFWNLIIKFIKYCLRQYMWWHSSAFDNVCNECCLRDLSWMCCSTTAYADHVKPYLSSPICLIEIFCFPVVVVILFTIGWLTTECATIVQMGIKVHSPSTCTNK